jgi:hypothetical protein
MDNKIRFWTVRHIRHVIVLLEPTRDYKQRYSLQKILGGSDFHDNAGYTDHFDCDKV